MKNSKLKISMQGLRAHETNATVNLRTSEHLQSIVLMDT